MQRFIVKNTNDKSGPIQVRVCFSFLNEGKAMLISAMLSSITQDQPLILAGLPP